MRRSRIIMGTGVSIDIPTAPEAVFEVAFKRLKDIDARFSPYKPGSELSKYNDGELSEPRLSREMKFIIHVCRRAEEKTGGYFSAWYGDHFEPSGYVKGWAIAEVGKMIKKAGYETFCIGIGGDILAASDGIKEWKVGVQDPDRKKYLTSQVFLKNGAIATSGNYERGPHIINPKTGQPADELLSLSVVGPDIIWADVLATAGFAAGKAWRKVLEKHPAYEALAVEAGGQMMATDGFFKAS